MTVVTSFLPLRERKKRDTRHRILVAGLDAFTARGFENCTIDEIARTAGVGKGTVYNYFRTKEDLVVAFMVDMERQMQAEAATLAQARGSAASILTRFIVSQMALKAPHYPFVRLFLAQLAGRATHADAWVGEASTALDPPLVQLFEKLQTRGLVRTDVDVPTLVGTFKVVQLGLMVLWAVEGPPWAGIGEIVRQQVRLFCSGIDERNGASRRGGERVKRVQAAAGGDRRAERSEPAGRRASGVSGSEPPKGTDAKRRRRAPREVKR